MIRTKISLFFVVICLLVAGCSNKPIMFQSKVVDIKDGNFLVLENQQIVDPIGFFIPKGEENYSPVMDKYLENLILKKKATFKIIAKAKIDYPKFSLVEVEVDGVNINEKMLEDGMAFFDHGYYPGKEKFENIEDIAKKKGKGIWIKDGGLKVLYIGSRKWNYFHYADCPEVKQIELEDKIYYYFYPHVIFHYRKLDLTCHYCANKYREEGGTY